MNDAQAKQIFDTVIRGHWENWPPGNEELYVWMKALQPFDFNLARDAINELYAGWKGERYPKMAHILAAIRENARSRFQQGKIVKLYAIFRADGRLRWKPFWGNAKMPRQDIEVQAEQKLTRANEIEAGHYIQYYGVNGEVDTGYYGDPKLSIAERRAQARDKAFADILNGPDNKTRQWLMKYLERKYPEKPGDIGDMATCIITKEK